MKNLFPTVLTGLLCLGISFAEPRAFTNKDGKTLEAELIGVEDGSAVLKLANRSKAKVPLDSLSKSDQEFVKTWWEENKNKVRESDVKLSIDKLSKRMKEPKDDDKKGKDKKKVSKGEVRYSCVVNSYTRKDLSDITVDYTVYKRVSSRGEEGSSTTTEEITGSTTIASLEGLGSASFETDAVVCEDMSQKGGKGPSSSKRESVIGVVVTLSVGGEEFLKQSHPDNFLGRLEEEAKREEERDE